MPTKLNIDLPLTGGSVLFGVGWGMAGFCPGGAIAVLGSGQLSPVAFTAAMIGDIVVANALRVRSASRQHLTGLVGR